MSAERLQMVAGAFGPSAVTTRDASPQRPSPPNRTREADVRGVVLGPRWRRANPPMRTRISCHVRFVVYHLITNYALH